jgi:hypothetical protein
LGGKDRVDQLAEPEHAGRERPRVLPGRDGHERDESGDALEQVDCRRGDDRPGCAGPPHGRGAGGVGVGVEVDGGFVARARRDPADDAVAVEPLDRLHPREVGDEQTRVALELLGAEVAGDADPAGEPLDRQQPSLEPRGHLVADAGRVGREHRVQLGVVLRAEHAPQPGGRRQAEGRDQNGRPTVAHGRLGSDDVHLIRWAVRPVLWRAGQLVS